MMAFPLQPPSLHQRDYGLVGSLNNIRDCHATSSWHASRHIAMQCQRTEWVEHACGLPWWLAYQTRLNLVFRLHEGRCPKNKPLDRSTNIPVLSHCVVMVMIA
jgi:hypothetical protein